MIDRRIFLQLTGGAAAGAASVTASAPAGAMARGASPNLAQSLVQVGDGIISPLADPLRILGERLALATDGRLALRPAGISVHSIEADRLVLTFEDEFADREPTSHLLGGSPFDASAALLDFSTWLRAMGGQAMWDEAAARAGWKPLMIGRLSRDDVQVWSRVPLHGPSDLAGLRVAASPVLSSALKKIGAIPTAIRPSALLAAFRADEIDVFETGDPAVSLGVAQEAADMRPHWYSGSLAGTDRVLSLRLPIAVWESLPPSDRAILEAVAEDTAAILRAVRSAHVPLLLGAIRRASERRGPAVPASIRLGLAAETATLLQELDAIDPVFRNARASMSVLVQLALQKSAFDWEYEPA